MDTPNPHIPARIHMIWFGPDPMPPAYIDHAAEWQRAYPHCTFHIWNEGGYKEKIPAYNERIFKRAKMIKPNDAHRLRADVARLNILYELGGLYVDCDSQPRGDMSELLGAHSFVAGRSPQHINGEHPITNSIIGASAGHPFLKHAIDELEDSVHKYKHRNVAQMVGPWHLTRTYKNHPELHDQVHIMEAGVLYDGTYLVHHWDNRKRRKGQAPR